MIKIVLTPEARSRAVTRCPAMTWLVTWDGAPEELEGMDRIVAILPKATSIRTVRSYVEMLWARSWCTLQDLALLAVDRNGAQRAWIVETTPGNVRVVCGDSPLLVARRVQNLITFREDETRREKTGWSECGADGSWQLREDVRPHDGPVRLRLSE
jgi:hypothetical protein